MVVDVAWRLGRGSLTRAERARVPEDALGVNRQKLTAVGGRGVYPRDRAAVCVLRTWGLGSTWAIVAKRKNGT